ncbi:MAG: T9SS type A sorting domain-containing protein [Bacteroidia bacterium]|nr:T9SS type A sorting domain-containing protein [Bacteroidia bacterium]
MFKAQNLIRNGSFESYFTPINWNLWGGDFIGYYSNPPDTIMIDWKAINSPDYFNSACTHTYSGVPKNKFGEIYAKDGNNVVGIETVYNNSETKEYIYQKLSPPLQAGKIYCLSFYVSRADKISYAVKSIGAYFSNSTQTTSGLGYINVIPQVVNQSGFITDTIGWTQIQGCFTANGGEQYITIGNFNSNANTDTLRIQPVNALSTSTVDIAYYFIDDITLIDQSTVGINEFVNANAFKISPNPTTDVLNIDVATTLDVTKNLTIKITDVLGKELVLTDYQTQINLSHLETGIYFVSILQGNQSLVTKKVVKQ